MDADRGGKQNINFTGFNPLDIPDIQIRKLGKLLLAQVFADALPPDIIAQLL